MDLKKLPKLASGVTGNIPDFESGESTFDPWEASHIPDTRPCRHCARPANRHGKYLGGCMQGGKALKTTFEPLDKSKRPV